MLKLLLCLTGGVTIGVLTLQLRQQHLELSHQTAQLHDQIRSRQGKLWDQQVQIAIYTAPNAIRKTIETHDLKLTPQSPLPGGKRSWIDVRNDPAAE
jgi:cell division protein FtsL